MGTNTLSSAELNGLLERWVETGLISGEQAEHIRSDTATLPAKVPSRGASLVTEAMAYLGGVIVLVGLGLVIGRFWGELSTAARVGLAGVVAALLMVAGGAIPAALGAAGTRLRAVLWVASASALFACLALLGAEGFAWDGNEIILFAAGGTTVVAAVMWMVHRHLLQHAALLVSLLMTAGAASAMIFTDSFLAAWTVVWGIGVGWTLLAWLEVIRPRRVGMVFGSVAAVVGGLVIESENWGTVIALLTVAALVAAAVMIRDLVLLGVAALGTLAVLPSVIVRYFPGVLSAALTLVVVGLLLVVAAVFTARRGRRPSTPAVSN